MNDIHDKSQPTMIVREAVVDAKTQQRLRTKKINKAELQKKLEEQYEKDMELVLGVFRYLEHPGGSLHFRRKKYAQEEYTQYELKDGERYRLPRHIVHHLNNNVHYWEYNHLGNGAQIASHDSISNGSHYKVEERMNTKVRKPRCEFMPLEFSNDAMELMPPAKQIIQVTRYNLG